MQITCDSKDNCGWESHHSGHSWGPLLTQILGRDHGRFIWNNPKNLMSSVTEPLFIKVTVIWETNIKLQCGHYLVNHIIPFMRKSKRVPSKIFYKLAEMRYFGYLNSNGWIIFYKMPIETEPKLIEVSKIFSISQLFHSKETNV